MVQCFAPDCLHRNDRDGCQMFRFPKSPNTRRKWKSLIRRADRSPGKGARLCSCHFEDGTKGKCPSLFSWNTAKRILFPSAEKKKRRISHAQRPQGTQAPDSSSPRSIEMERTIDGEKSLEPSSCLGHAPATEMSTENNEMEVDFHCNDKETLEHSLSSADNVGVDFEGKDGRSKSVISPSRSGQQDHSNCLSKERCEELEKVVKQLERQNEELRTHRTAAVIAEAESTLLKTRIKEMEETMAKLKSPKDHRIFLFSWIANKDYLVAHFTGLPNQETFNALLKMFENQGMNYIKGWKVTRFTRTEQLFLTLCKLRRALSFQDLALRYGVDPTTISNNFRTWLLALHEVIFKRLMKKVPSRFQNQKYLPNEFKKDYENTRMVIDCTEIFAARPSLISRQNQLFSSYKHRITLKALVGISPHGAVTYVSKLYPGRTSDKEIVAHCGILSTFVESDVVMADKGFLIQSLLPPGVTLNIPPFSVTPQFTPEEIEETTSIAKSRIHVERAIQRIKVHKILDYIPQNLFAYATEVFQVCAALTNFRKPLIQDSYEELDME